MAVSTNDLKNGMSLDLPEGLFSVVEFQHVKPGKGGAFVRTNAPPLPGLTCWNSTTLNRPSGRSRLMPFFRSLVETAMDVLCEAGQWAGAVLGHDQGVLDTDAAV